MVANSMHAERIAHQGIYDERPPRPIESLHPNVQQSHDARRHMVTMGIMGAGIAIYPNVQPKSEDHEQKNYEKPKGQSQGTQRLRL